MTTTRNETCSATPALAGTEAYLLTEFTRLDSTNLLEIVNPWDNDEDLIQLFKAQSPASEDAIDWSGLKDFYLSRHTPARCLNGFGLALLRFTTLTGL